MLAVLLGGPLAVVGVWRGLKWREKHRPKASLRRQRRELIASLDGAVGREDFYAYLADVVQSYLRLVFALPAGEVSVGMLARAMNRHGVEERVRCQIEELLTVCDSGRFTSQQAG